MQNTYSITYIDKEGTAHGTTATLNCVRSAWTQAKKFAGNRINTVEITKV